MEFNSVNVTDQIHDVAFNFGLVVNEIVDNGDESTLATFLETNMSLKISKLPSNQSRLDVIVKDEVIFSTENPIYEDDIIIYESGVCSLHYQFTTDQFRIVSSRIVTDENEYIVNQFDSIEVLKAYTYTFDYLAYSSVVFDGYPKFILEDNHLYGFSITGQEGCLTVNIDRDGRTLVCNRYDLGSYKAQLMELFAKSELEGDKFIDLPVEVETPSIVPDDVNVITLVALIFDGVVAAYRFKTDMGYFDITRKKAMEYGVSGFKVEKAIRLERYNGMLVTQSEIKNRRCIPDISGSADDCRKLFESLFG